ncbi:hypothetical protein C7999DRAFT_11033 [Corynascus novoguineensis]|uniref:Uncharacterized protein n=1 Tax=Corynascus novoguineensis TaxID=1126955 RepID=A0AAN7D233_9PEZI|nr:hypothetical protein C7999DRAFT_11033 [Corynascus novoguineensis]
MPPPRSSDTSSSTLTWSRLDTSLHQLLPPPPPEEVERYENRPLPPLPPQQNSGVSTSCKEVDGALTTPEPVVSPGEANIDFMFSGETSPGNKHVKIACRTNLHLDKSRNREVLWVNTADVLRLGCNTLSSQEPQPELSILEVQLHGEISPLSNDSSDHSIKEPRTAVSDLDGDVEGHGMERSSGLDRDHFSSRFSYRCSIGSPAVPGPWCVTNPPRQNCSSKREVFGPPPRGRYSYRYEVLPHAESERRSWERNTLNDKPSLDLYQEVAKKLAEGNLRAAQQAQRIPLVQLAPQQMLRVERASSTDYQHSEAKQLPPRSLQHLAHRQPERFCNTRIPWSTEQLKSVRGSSAVHGTPRAVNASTPDRLSQEQQYSIPPAPSAELCSRMSPLEIGGSHRVVSVAGSDMSSRERSKTGIRHHRHCHSSSIPVEVSQCSSSSSMASSWLLPAAPSLPTGISSALSQEQQPPPPPPNLTNTAQRDLPPPQHGSTHHNRTLKVQPVCPNPNPHPSSSSSPRLLALKAKKSVSMLVAAKASNLIGVAANLVYGTLGGGEKERRRQRLKSTIRVLGDGGRVLASV